MIFVPSFRNILKCDVKIPFSHLSNVISLLRRVWRLDVSNETSSSNTPCPVALSQGRTHSLFMSLFPYLSPPLCPIPASHSCEGQAGDHRRPPPPPPPSLLHSAVPRVLISAAVLPVFARVLRLPAESNKRRVTSTGHLRYYPVYGNGPTFFDLLLPVHPLRVSHPPSRPRSENVLSPHSFFFPFDRTKLCPRDRPSHGHVLGRATHPIQSFAFHTLTPPPPFLSAVHILPSRLLERTSLLQHFNEATQKP